MDIASFKHAPPEGGAAKRPIAGVARRMNDGEMVALAVGRNVHLNGRVAHRDLALRKLGDPTKTKAEDAINPAVGRCSTTRIVEDSMHMTKQKKRHRLPVTDDLKRRFGRQALGDIGKEMPWQMPGKAVNAVPHQA